MKIPTGNFGYLTPDRVDNSAVARATDRLGQIVTGIGQQANDRAQALARAKDGTAYQDHALAVDELKVDYADKISSGDIPYENAQKAFETDAAKIPAPVPTARDPAAAEVLSRSAQNSIKRAGLDISQVAAIARDKDLQAQGVSQLDTLGKRVSLPGADVDSINAQADAVGQVLRAGGLSEVQVARTLQNFKDSNWYNQAMQRAVTADTDLPALRSVLHDLTAADGYYAGKLDADKRNSLQAAVENKIDRLEMRGQAAADRAEVRGERAIMQIERQISSAVPATPEMWTDWASTVKGTNSEADFKELVGTEQQIQKALRAPVADQVRLVQETQTALKQGGGTVAQKANADRLEAAVTANVKQLMTQPVVFGEERLGDKNQPIDINGIFDQGTQVETAAILQERAARVRALGKQFGAPVPMLPLLPQEAKQLAGVITQGSPTQAASLYSALADAAGSPDVYRGMMQQVAPDAPVRALAGLLASQQRELTTATHWYKPDDVVSSRDVAATMLEGDRLLNRSSTAKAEDGKAQTKLVLPETKALQDRFAREVGTVFAGRPQAAELAFQGVQAYYAGRVAQTGMIAKGTDDVDTNLVRESVRATLGNVVDFNGRGDVVAPWGMAEDDFKDRVMREVGAEAQRRGITEMNDAQRMLLGLRNANADGVYVLRIGRRDMLDDAGNPVLLDIRPHDERDRHGYISRTP